MARLSPLQQVKKDHGSKQALVDSLVDKLHAHEGENKDDLRARLLRVSNKKLLRLNKAHSRLEADFGSKGKLVDAILDKRAPRQKNDTDYRSKLTTKSVSQLLDLHDSARRKA